MSAAIYETSIALEEGCEPALTDAIGKQGVWMVPLELNAHGKLAQLF